ncbi:MAG TPA: hypothetical protein DCX34_09670 [Roseovarius sp.]|nr:hypothetical protein [Roseovarius sp.]
MNQIEELQTRITAALERIQRGVEARAEAEAVRKDDDATDGAELATLRQELEDERLVTAQLEERIRVLHERLEEKEAALAAAQDGQDGQGAQSETMTRLDTDLQSLRAANAQLRESNAALRTAHAAGVANPDAINASLQAELDALRVARDADHDEVAAVLAEIDSAVAGAAPGAADQTEDA